MSNPKEVAIALSTIAKEKGVRFPKIWDDSQVVLSCGAVLMTHRKDDGFDLDAALEGLIEKYGQEDIVKKTPTKKRKDDGVVDLTGDEDVASNKKVKKTATVANEFNRPVAEAITELAGLYFKNKDTRKGGVYAKAAKALRDCETEIRTLKEAMALKGVGKGIATYVMEMIDTGVIKKLEEVRAGYA